MKTNKEVIEEIVAHLMEHADMKTVCRALANCMIDYHRLSRLEDLPQAEKDNLASRIKINTEELVNFANGTRQPFFKIIIMNSDG